MHITRLTCRPCCAWRCANKRILCLRRIHQLVELVPKSGCLTNTVQFEQDVLERERIGRHLHRPAGSAIPHAKSAGVAHAELAALTLDPPLPCDTPDGEPVRLLFFDRCTGRCQRPACADAGGPGHPAAG